MFNQRNYLFAMIAILTAYLGGVLFVSAYRHDLARDHPALVSLFSHSDGLFSWSGSYSGGHVGPFSIGDSKSEVLKAAADCNCFLYYPDDGSRPMNVQPTTTFLGDEAYLKERNNFINGYYMMVFSGDRLMNIRRGYNALSEL